MLGYRVYACVNDFANIMSEVTITKLTFCETKRVIIDNDIAFEIDNVLQVFQQYNNKDDKEVFAGLSSCKHPICVIYVVISIIC